MRQVVIEIDGKTYTAVDPGPKRLKEFGEWFVKESRITRAVTLRYVGLEENTISPGDQPYSEALRSAQEDHAFCTGKYIEGILDLLEKVIIEIDGDKDVTRETLKEKHLAGLVTTEGMKLMINLCTGIIEKLAVSEDTVKN